MDRRETWFWVLGVFALGVAAADDSTESAYDADPILRYRPQFARSLPIQILVTGMVLTLVSVLLIHLIFTANYHWRLAQANCVLQISAATILFTQLVASLKLVLDSAIQESREWPFMLTYVSVDLPPLEASAEEDGWETSNLVLWLLMNATTSALIQITHIQFLTLLYPSRLEARLIFILLGPLAIVAAIMQLIPIQDNSTSLVIADAIRNVCNFTLSLLFTFSLLLWGGLVNRKQAWRTDGGTAAFGAGAVLLAVLSTALTAFFIPSKNQYEWMLPLTWAVMLWQSFLGWWWWVGSGMGVGEVDEWMEREEKRRVKRREREKTRREKREKYKEVWKGVQEKVMGGGKTKQVVVVEEEVIDGEGDEDGTRQLASPPLSRTTSNERSESASTTTINTATGSSPASNSNADNTNTNSPLWRRAMSASYTLFHRGYLGLRTAHILAARRQAEKQVVIINEVYGREGEHEVANRTPRVHGWGLGSFGLREREAHDRDRERIERRREGVARIEEREEGASGDVESSVDAEGITESRRRRRDVQQIEDDGSDDDDPRKKKNKGGGAPGAREEGWSMWWWGPLRRWRLQDSTVY